MKTLLLILLINNPTEHQCTVLKVNTGSTIIVDFTHIDDTHKKERITLEGIEAPSLKIGTLRHDGLLSREALREKIIGKDIIIVVKDHYRGLNKEITATLFLNGKNINKWMVENGYAHHKTYKKQEIVTK